MEIRTDTSCMYNIVPWHAAQGHLTPDSQIDHNKESREDWIVHQFDVRVHRK